jgi:protein-S-isoprenylcysteine O-methyltransferase Ste14
MPRDVVVAISPIWLSGILWVAFIFYWSAAARNSAPTISAESPQSRQIHQLMMWGALLLLFLRFPPLDRRWFPTSGLLEAIGLGIQGGAFALAAWARRHLGRNWSAAITTKAEHRLVLSGPYRAIRHPIYSAMLGMFLGTTLISGELHALVAFLVMSGAYWRKIRLEERRLREVFGTEYEDYMRHSRALIPLVL